MNQKRNNISSSDLMFEEEVSEKEILENFDKNQKFDDYRVKSNKNFIILLLIILFLISLFAFMFGFLYFDRERGDIFDNGEVIVNRYSLYVVHSNEYFGASNISFEKYNSLDNAYDYSVNITNKNSIDIDYSCVLNNPYFGSDNVDMSQINYTLYNGGVIINSGVLDNSKEINLASLNIKSNTINQLELKLWSSTISDDLKFSFKVNILV